MDVNSTGIDAQEADSIAVKEQLREVTGESRTICSIRYKASHMDYETKIHDVDDAALRVR